MTPTLLGRWQTRIFLMWTVGAFITLVFGILTRNILTPFVVLAYVTLFGLGWDAIYAYLQATRWDRDWPPIYFVTGAIIEAIFLWVLLKAGFVWHIFGFRSLPGVSPTLTFTQFALHYVTVWLITFVIVLGPLKAGLLKWRFQGGRWF